jgi:hypothetical protein
MGTIGHSVRRAAVVMFHSPKAVLAATALLLLALQPVTAVAVCVGDCSEDGRVTVDEVLTMVNAALGLVHVSTCLPSDPDSNGTVTIDEILAGVSNALNGCSTAATPTPTPTGGSHSYVGDYNGTAGSYGVRFHVAANGTASGFLDFLTSDAASVAASRWQRAAASASYAASGSANLVTGAYQLDGTFFGNPFHLGGQLPASPDATGTLTVSIPILGVNAEGTLNAGTAAPAATATPTPGCDSANLQMTFSGVSADFNGTASSFAVTRVTTAIEQKAPDFIAGLHEVYNSTFIGTDCTQPRNIRIDIFEVPGGLAAGQSFPASQDGGSEAGAIVYYGQETPGGDKVWSSSAGTVFIDAINGSVVTLRVVGAAMTVPAGTAAGSFTLDVSGQVNTFTRQP